MEKDTAVRSKLLLPFQLAEEANRGFIKMIQYLSRAINYDFHKPRSESVESRPRDGISSSSNRRRNFSLKRELDAFNSSPTSNSVLGSDDVDQPTDEYDFAKIITLLFSDFADERMLAIKWISYHKYGDALPMLESILLIEDDNEVYEAVCSLIDVLKGPDIERPDRK